MLARKETEPQNQEYRILLVDDDGILLESLQRQLSNKGYKVDIALSAQGALTMAIKHQYDAFVLDVTFGDGDGRDVCRHLRDRGESVPILLMTALESDEDELRGLASGSNDYIRKPIRFDVLEARLRSQIEINSSKSKETIYLNGGFIFMPVKKHMAFEADENTVKLTEKEVLILNHLLKARGSTVTREEFLEYVWQYRPDTNTHTLETHIYRLRKKLIGLGGDPNMFLRTDMGGYRIVLQ